MVTIPDDARRGTLIALEPRLKVPFHPLYHEIAERRELSGSAKVVYAVLCSYLNMFDTVFPGRERLARDAGEPQRSLTRYLNELKDVGLLSVERRGLGMTNVYTLLTWPRGWAKVANQVSQSGPSELAGLASHIPIEEEGLKEEVGQLLTEEPDAAAIWQEAKEVLRLGTTAANYQTYVEGTQGLRIEGGVLVVGVPSQSQLRALRDRWEPTAALAARMPVRFEG